MQFGVLGPLEVVDETGSPVDVGGRQPRTVLAVLLLTGGRPVPSGTLVDALWAGAPPPSATGTLQSYISRLRQRLAGSDAELLFDEAGYRLQVDAEHVDAHRFTRHADEGHALLEVGRWEEAHEVLQAADALWRGPALVDLLDVDAARGAAARLEERRLAAAEDRMAAALALGRHATAASELTELVAANPLREGLQAQLALALYRSGRQAEALRALALASRTLRDELGIEPGRPLRDLEAAILGHDPSLDLAAPTTRPPAPPPPTLPTERTGPELVGRDGELAELVAALDEARRDARFVVVEGEPGIGKSRLVDELRDLAVERGSRALWGRADEGGAAPALWPWLPPLRGVAQAVGAVPDEIAELLDGTAELATSQQPSARFERFELVAELLERAGADAPLVVLLDDLQWADPTSLELLAHVAGRVERGLLVVATMRELDIGRNDTLTATLAAIARRRGSRRIALRGLSLASTASMLEAVGARPLPDALAQAIHARAEGNPFYAIELSRLVHEEDGLDGDVPGTVRDVVRRRISRLPPATVELLGLAAVLGRDVELALLAASGRTSVVEAAEVLDPAVVHRLLVEVPARPGVLRFSHALVREVLQGDLTALRRARLHLQVADAIEASGAGPDEAEILAEHLWRAAPVGVGRRAAEALEGAAEVALRRISFAAAEDLLTKAVQLRRATGATREDQLAELRTHLHLLEVERAVRYFQGTDQQLLHRALDLAERLDERDAVLQLRWFHWSARATAARVREATPLAAEFLALADADPRPEIRSLGHEVFGVSCWGRGRISEAVDHLDQSLALLEGAPPAADAFDAEHRMVAALFSIVNHGLQGDRSFEDCALAFDEMAAAATDMFTMASVCGFAATTACAGGIWEDVDRFSRNAAEADPAAQFAFWSGQTRMQRGIVLAWQGDVDAGLEQFAGGHDQYTRIDGRSALPTFLASMAIHLATAGRPDEADRMAVEARHVLETWEERWNEPVVAMAEGLVAHHTGDRAASEERLAAAVAIATEQGAHGLARRARRTAEDFGIAPG